MTVRSPARLTAPPRHGVVILTMGRRPQDLRRAVASVLAQRDVGVELAVVGNGWRPEGLPPEVDDVTPVTRCHIRRGYRVVRANSRPSSP